MAAERDGPGHDSNGHGSDRHDSDRHDANRHKFLAHDFPGPGARTYRPRPALLIAGLAIAVIAGIVAIFDTDPLDRVVAVTGALALLLGVLLGYRRRLVTGPRGLLVGGLGGTRIIPWSQVHDVSTVKTGRLGVSTSSIEIDLVDDSLLVFGRTDLGADPAEVADELTLWWPRP